MKDLFENLVYSKDDVIRFPEGIPGFESCREFVLARVPEHEPFAWLLNTADNSLRFAVIDPLIVRSDYDPKVSKGQLAPLELTAPADLMILVIITLKSNLLESTANFVGPLFINKKKMVGRQIVLDSDKWSVQEPVIRS